MSEKNKRIYRAPLGATSITVAGTTYEVDAKGNLECSDDAAHADLLSHGYSYGDDAPAGAADVVDPVTFERALSDAREELATRARELDKREFEFTDHIVARTGELNARAAELDELTATLAASRAELANKETDLTMRIFAVQQREEAVGKVEQAAAAAPKSTKAKG